MSEASFCFIDGSAATPLVGAEAIGSKAAQLAVMSRLGLPVPPAFVMPTRFCAPINSGDDNALESLQDGLRQGIAQLEAATGRHFGDRRKPLLVSVRSGAAKSMPGMLETILNVGLNPDSLRGLIRLTGNPRLAWDSYRRFIQGYAEVVLELSPTLFEAALAEMLKSEQVASEAELDAEALERLTQAYREIAQHVSKTRLPDDPMEQLLAAAIAVFRSWESPRAQEYRRLNALEGLSGTAVTVQAMVFGNAGSRSGAGVAFSRNPATGAPGLYVDFVLDAQGEDVVSGRRSPGDAALLTARLPRIVGDLAAGAKRLERECGDLQDIEFTVEEGRLYFLQTRSAKRTPRAALQCAIDLVHEGIIDAATGLARIGDIDLGKAGTARFLDRGPAVASAVSASPGMASGRVVFDSRRAKELAAEGSPVILIRRDISTEDIAGLAVAEGILTAIGARTAHAAVVARQLGKVCLVACAALDVTDGARQCHLAGQELREGDWLSLDGETGEISLGQSRIASDPPEAALAEIARWRRMAGEPGSAAPPNSHSQAEPAAAL
ncbi:MAG TPA: PEP/pyruvate-binding domain-containing protein [Terriglobales bacterium]|nr:PEP/pyruvate-binding domain-containing protein [Terriglobales bacterium]